MTTVDPQRYTVTGLRGVALHAQITGIAATTSDGKPDYDNYEARWFFGGLPIGEPVPVVIERTVSPLVDPERAQEILDAAIRQMAERLGRLL